MQNNGQKWTREQINLLKENFMQGKTLQEITKIINEHIKDKRPGTVKTIRSVDSIAHKLKNMELISEKELNDMLKAKSVLIKFHRLNNYDEIKKIVFSRDKNKCVTCGTRQNLQLAHIVPFRETLVKNNIELITLCKKCHKIFDNLNEFETEKIFNYMSKLFPDYPKKYKITRRYNPVTSKDLCEIKRI